MVQNYSKIQNELEMFRDISLLITLGLEMIQLLVLYSQQHSLLLYVQLRQNFAKIFINKLFQVNAQTQIYRVLSQATGSWFALYH